MLSILKGNWTAPSIRPFSFAESSSNPIIADAGPGVTSECPPPSCLRDVIARTPKFYRFSCLTGIIKPVSGDNTGGCTNWNLRFRLWVQALHILFFLQTVIVVPYAVLEFAYFDAKLYEIIIVAACFGIFVQNILLVPAVMYLRKELTASRTIDLNIYNQAFQYSMIRGRILFCALTLLLLLFLILIAVGVGGAAGMGTFAILFALFLPSNCFLTGVFAFLVMEQRLSYFAMRDAESMVDNRTITRKSYFLIRESIDYRDNLSPTNWLVSAAFLSTLLMVVIIIAAHEVEDWDLLEMLGAVALVVSVFGRQIVVLIMYLYQMAHVNAVAESMLEKTARADWDDDNLRRLDLYVLMKEFPMGTTLFFYRPSRFALLLEMFSAVIGLGIAIFWAFVFA